METQDLIATAEAYFARAPHPDIVAAYLFGSVARGTSRRDSDVDIGVLFARTPPPTLDALPGALQAELEALLGRPVQIVVLNRASADLVHRVLRDGKLIHESDRSARIRFEMRSRQIYLDLLPLRSQYRCRRASPAREGT